MNIHLTSYGQGTPVVFFHGWGFDQQIWMPLIADLSMSYRIFLVDLPGFGFTPIMDWDAFKAQLLGELPQHFAVVGWSLGGLYAQRLAFEEAKRVSALMSIASSPRFIEDPTWPAVSKKVFTQFYDNLSQDIEGTLKDFLSLQLNKNQISLHLGKIPSQAGLEAGLKVLDEWDLRDQLKNFTNPACFLFGRLDPITPARLMNTMKMVYPHFNYVLFKRSAHMPFLSHKDLFIDELRRFI